VLRAFASDEFGNRSVNLQFDADGAKRFYDLSRLHSTRGGRGLPFVIVLDGEILSAPVFLEPIAGGQAKITGDFTEKQARSMASAIMNPLPRPMIFLSREVLTPKKGL